MNPDESLAMENSSFSVSKKSCQSLFFVGQREKSVLHGRIREKKVACIVVKAKAQVIGVILGEHLWPDFGGNLAERHIRNI